MEKMYSYKGLIKQLGIEIEAEITKDVIYKGVVYIAISSSNIEVYSPTQGELVLSLVALTRQKVSQLSMKKPAPTKKMVSKPRKKTRKDLIIPEFMAYLHTRQCIVEGCTRENIEAHHIIGRQPNRYDNLCVPLCSDHHRGSEYSWHEGNVRQFRIDYTIERLADISIDIFDDWLSECIDASKVDEYNIYRDINNCIRIRDYDIAMAMEIAVGEIKKG